MESLKVRLTKIQIRETEAMEGLLVQEAEHGANHRDATRTWLDIRRKIEKRVKGRLPVAYCMKYKLWKSSYGTKSSGQDSISGGRRNPVCDSTM